MTTRVNLAGSSCLVTGSSGFLGSFVVERLLEAGASVRCLVRRSSNCDFLLGQPVQYAFGDITDTPSLVAALQGIDFVFHLAGLIKARAAEDFFRVNYLGTINLLEASRRQSPVPRRVVVVSSLAAVGPSSPSRPLDETSPCHPLSPYGQSKLQAETAARSYTDTLDLTIVRPPTIFGPRDRETLSIFKLAALGIVPRTRQPGEISTIHATDLADGIVKAALHPAAVGQTYFMANDDILSLDQLVGAITESLGRPSVRVPVPDWAIRAGGRVAERVRDVSGASLIFDRWKAEEIVIGNWACSNARAKEEIGFSPQISLQDGLADTAHWYRKMGWL